MALLKLTDFSLSLDGEPLLENIHLNVHQEEHIAILGRSGCGKSSLLKAILELNHPFAIQGSVERPQACAYMAQQDALLPWLTVLENVNLSQRLHGNTDAKKARLRLEEVGLTALAHKKTYQLSGGQRQRVALARTLTQQAQLILMDEPFSAIDAITHLELQQLTKRVLRKHAVILITHNPLEAIRLADRIYVIQNKTLSAPFFTQSISIDDVITPQIGKLHNELLDALSL